MTLSCSQQRRSTVCHAIVFDLDDTLYPEYEYAFGGFRAVARWAESNLSVPSGSTFAEISLLFDAGHRGDIFDRWLKMRNLPKENVTLMVAAYREHIPTIAPFPGVRDLLESLRQKCSIGLVTDGHVSVQRAKVRALNIGQMFDATVYSDELGPSSWKPSPKPFQEIIARLSVQPRNTIYVADNPIKDFRGARKIGLYTIWAKHSGGDYTKLTPPAPEFEPDHMVRTLKDLGEFLYSFLERQTRI